MPDERDDDARSCSGTYWVSFAKGKGFKITNPDYLEYQYIGVKYQPVVLGVRPEHLYERMIKDSVFSREALKVTVEVIKPVSGEVLVLASFGSVRFTACSGPNTSDQPHAYFEMLKDMKHPLFRQDYW